MEYKNSLFPKVISFTLTNHCNLRCHMCGQWGIKGYMKKNSYHNPDLPVSLWEKTVNEIAKHNVQAVCIRGGEPFLYPEVIDLLTHIKSKNLHISIDTNGTLLKKYAEDIVKLKIDALNISIDGPSEIHNKVRGVKNCFQQIEESIKETKKYESQNNTKINKTVCFTISEPSYKGLDEMPDVTRQLGIENLCIVPYYYYHEETGESYEHIMKKYFTCQANSWQGFYRKESGININQFIQIFKRFKNNLREINLIPFMDYTEDNYIQWFKDDHTKVDTYNCQNPWRLLDIQPNGDVNFCVDFPDYIIGNINEHSLSEIWNNDKSEKFRTYLKKQSLPICNRCGAKYMSK